MEQSQYEIHAEVDRRHWWWRARREILRDAIARYAPRVPDGELRLAEIGCAAGGNLPMLAGFGRVIGAEANPSAVERLRREPIAGVSVLEHRIPDPLPAPCHVLGMFDVIEHVEDDRGALAWAGEQLEPGGIAVVTVPAFGFLWTEQDEAVHHFRRYTKAMLGGLVAPPLEVVHLGCFNTLLFPPILAVRTLMRLTRRRDRPPRSHLLPPPEPLNELLYRLMRLERLFVVRQSCPLGVSLMLVARRLPEAPALRGPRAARPGAACRPRP